MNDESRVISKGSVLYPQTPQQRQEAEFRAEVRSLLEALETRLQAIEIRLEHLERHVLPR
jgi:hypothetical protein